MSEKKVIIASIFIFILIVGVLTYDRYSPKDIQWATITIHEKALLMSGDIVFTDGNSVKSDAVRMVSGAKDGIDYSHCGIIIIESDNVYVVHMSINQGMIVKELIDNFWITNRVNDYAICRVEGSVSTQKIEEELNKLLHNKVLFDNGYNAMDSEELYCTELVCYVYDKVSDVNLYPFEDQSVYIYPNNLFEIPILTKIL